MLEKYLQSEQDNVIITTIACNKLVLNIMGYELTNSQAKTSMNDEQNIVCNHDDSMIDI